MYDVLNKKYYLDINEILEFIKMRDIEQPKILIKDSDENYDDSSDYKINTIKWDMIRYLLDGLMIDGSPEDEDEQLNKLPLVKGLSLNTLTYYGLIKNYGE